MGLTLATSGLKEISLTRERRLGRCGTIAWVIGGFAASQGRVEALKLLRHHIAEQHLIVPGGKSIGPTSVHCVLSSCEASATVCHHQP